jgi:hypothetical protein
MAVTSTRQTTITFSGDINASVLFNAANNTAAPGDVDVLTLAAGANTVTLPTGGSTPKGATIVPPPGNTQAITLKGVAGDTGIVLHKTDPSTITFDTPPANFVLSAAGTVTGLRIIWT